MRLHRRSAGQALVELTLAITFIALLLAGAVDAGLAYKTHQMLTNATAEASSYLGQQPLIACVSGEYVNDVCPRATMKSKADKLAVKHFRSETGDVLKANGMAQLLDLNSDGANDKTSTDTVLVSSLRAGNWLRFDTADSSQFDPNNPGAFDIAGFTPTTNLTCVDRDRVYAGGKCFIVVRASINYKPFFSIAPFLGDGITIRAYAIKPIVGSP